MSRSAKLSLLAAAALMGSAPLTVAAQAPAPVAPATAPLPDTPAGRFVRTFLTAYNSADVAKLERYNALYARKTPPQDWIDMHATTGRFTPVRVTELGPNRSIVLLAAEIGDSLWEETVETDSVDPMKLVEVGLRQVDRPPEFAVPRLPRAALNYEMTRKLTADVAADRFAGTVIVQRHGQVIYRHAAGLADRPNRISATMDTRFRIGSANKMFTAVAVLQLVEQRKVALDGTVGIYLADYPNADFARTVTVRQLLTHTGGGGDIFTPEYEAKRQQVRTLADYVTLFGNRPPETGEARDAYSNFGFVLLGRILEMVSCQDYYDYVQRHVFEPAGMTATGSLPESTAVTSRSRGYTRKAGQLMDNADTLPWRGSSAGGGYTTASDMIRFGDALLAGRLLSPAMLGLATSPQRPDGWYGLGFWMQGEGRMRRWGHGGGAPGMNAAFRVYPELDAVVVALSNLDPLAADNAADFYANRMMLNE